MKKIVAVIGSPHDERSNTAALTRSFLTALASAYQGADGLAHQVISLGGKRIGMCRGCWTCTKTGACAITDDLQEVLDELAGADLVILGTPVYVDHVSAQMKAFLDRSFIWLHTMGLIGKPSLSVLTTAGSGKRAVRKYLQKILYLFGTIPLGHLQAVAYQSGEFPRGKACSRKIETLARRAARVLERGYIRPRWRNSLYFWAMKLKAKYGVEWLPYEHRYWSERGWFTKSYRQAAKTKRGS